MEETSPTCPYCGEAASLIESARIYGRDHGKMWRCDPCDAHVGIHKNSKKNKPLGRLANKELRIWKGKAHKAFDVLWKIKMKRDECTKSEARNAGYKWLAEKLGIKRRDCQIGMFDLEQCERTVEICASIGKNKRG